MSEDAHGVPGPNISALRAASAGQLLATLTETHNKLLAQGANLERYLTHAQALGATRQQATEALCGVPAPTEDDLHAALQRFMEGAPPMSDALRETVQHIVQSSPFSLAAVIGAARVLSTPTLFNPAFEPWTDEQIAEKLPSLAKLAANGGMSLVSVVGAVRHAA